MLIHLKAFGILFWVNPIKKKTLIGQGSGGKFPLKSPKQFLDNHFPNTAAINNRKLNLNVSSCKPKVHLLNNFHKKTICVNVCLFSRRYLNYKDYLSEMLKDFQNHFKWLFKGFL